jgi:hypothetical protein
MIYGLGSQFDVTEKIRAEEQLNHLNALRATADA